MAAFRFKPKNGGAKAEPEKGKTPPGASVAGKGRPGGSGRPGERKRDGGQTIYLLKEGKPEAVPVKTGIASNGAIELVEGNLKEGDEVVIEQQGGEVKKKQSSGSPMGRPF